MRCTYTILRSLAPLCTVPSVYELIQLEIRAQKLRRKAVSEMSSSNTQCVCEQVYIVCTYLSLAVCIRIYLLYANKWQIYCNLPQAMKNMSLRPQSAMHTDTDARH